jgi:hypothetical protein
MAEKIFRKVAKPGIKGRDVLRHDFVVTSPPKEGIS